MARHRPHPAAVLLTTATLALGVSGCGDDPDPLPTTPTPSSGTNYFGDTSFIGRTVTVTGIVTRVITERSFVLDTRDFGNDTLLVLCAPSRQVGVGDRVQLSGNVQKFAYQPYADEYNLAADAPAYAAFTGEEFLVTAQAMQLQ